MLRALWLFPALMMLASCARDLPLVDAGLAREIAAIKAIDNHAHPVLSTPGDREFDALPVDNMEAASDPVGLRPGEAAKAATQALFGTSTKAATIQQKGEQYPAWVLDRAGIEIMFANRVAMGSSIQPPRFRWVPYIDALLFPLDNAGLAARNSDRKAFFALEDSLRARYLNHQAPPATLAEYVAGVVTPTLERHRQGGAMAEKFEAAYLRSLAFDRVDAAQADRIYRQYVGKAVPPEADYKQLQDYLFRYIAAECGRLGMAVHLHTMAGAGGYFDVAGANPLHLEPLFDDPGLRQTKFVMVHGGWPFVREIGALLTKPNAYLDISAQTTVLPPASVAGALREWLAYVPEKVLFGTDAYPFSNELGWEESAWLAARSGREALGRALTGMMRDGEITHQRALELARMVLRDNARALYKL
jgi:hypothetical protein